MPNDKAGFVVVIWVLRYHLRGLGVGNLLQIIIALFFSVSIAFVIGFSFYIVLAVLVPKHALFSTTVHPFPKLKIILLFTDKTKITNEGGSGKPQNRQDQALCGPSRGGWGWRTVNYTCVVVWRACRAASKGKSGSGRECSKWSEASTFGQSTSRSK